MKGDRTKMNGWGSFAAFTLLSFLLVGGASAQVERAQVGIDGLT